ncbi:hypothetical protein EYF80_044500 [Liparis tanakae]|uniref:Uncharacterized protein n=1 Tax=Liparis tanakae TaxID=230148 RepID=A0A4Z2FWQ2_9TELE|nr:hypothetical protein EYF80_044500 [Liparis tanakae]
MFTGLAGSSSPGRRRPGWDLGVQATAEITWLRPVKYDLSLSLISSRWRGCRHKSHSTEERGLSSIPASFHVFTSRSAEAEQRGCNNTSTPNGGMILFSVTRTGMMWLGQWTTGRPASISIRRRSLTLLWWVLRSTRPSSLFRTLTDSVAPASSMGGREVVKMKPAA